MSEPIIFYDIPSTKPGKAWSPNTWKIRYVLNYKGIPYKTEWVEYPDIESLCKRIGAPPTGKKADGRDHYTLPAIFDPSTKKAISDSLDIAKYLEATYPNTPQLFSSGMNAFQTAFLTFLPPAFMYPTLMVTLDDIAKGLNPPSSVYFRTTREQQFGKLADTKSPKAWEDLEKGLGQVKSFLDANGEGNNLSFLGEKDKFTYSDIAVAATLVWLRIIAGEGSEDWKKVSGLNGGFAAKFLAQFKKYEAIDV